MSDKDEHLMKQTGTNELEVLVFTLGDSRFGVNVAKVREVIGQVSPKHVPKAHPAVVGVANLRGAVIPLVDLQLYFSPGSPSTCQHRHVIITEFNDLQMGFIVDGVEQIYRLSWKQVEPAPVNHTAESAAVTSISHIDERLVLMIDFERIALDIRGMDSSLRDLGPAAARPDRATRRVLLAEDSPTMRRYICEILEEAGYRNVTVTNNGAEAWTRLEQTSGPPFDLIISDIEMPLMDGLHLCKRIREHPQLQSLPVIIFSSLVSDENQQRMAAARADATVTKPQLVQLVEIIDEVLSREAVPA